MRRLLLALALAPLAAVAQPQIERVEPAFWWTGMAHDDLQVMVYGPDIGRTRASLAATPGVTLRQAVTVENPNYLFLTLEIGDDARPGTLPLRFDGAGGAQTLDYELRARTRAPGSYAQGFSSQDVIYLMMPDRFANGDPGNDRVAGMLEGVDRSNPDARQGGDFAGVRENLDYIADLGMTAIWFTPVFENDMTPEYGAYHGYAATDMYRVDRRFGTTDEFAGLVDAVHQRGMKVIMDMIHNHIGDQHWWMRDLPTSDWVHSLERYGTTNYRGAVAIDPYASQADLDRLTNAWFVPQMPDLNQDNELLAVYLLQNTVWWIEQTGVDGIRMDTYPYPDKDYMARWGRHVLAEYPDFNIVGEAWMQRTVHEAYWQRGFDAPDGYDSPIPSVTDFPLQVGLHAAVNEPTGWNTGLLRLYYTLTEDVLYPDPLAMVAFLDNHDIARTFSTFGESEARLRMAYALLMTLPRTPQVYYGTEIAMVNGRETGSDGYKRSTMPGGWPGDARSVFTASGRTERENRTYDYVRALTTWRRGADVVHHGRTTQWVPEDDVAVYVRWDDADAVMTVVNVAGEPRTLDMARFRERTAGYARGRDVATGQVYELGPTLAVPAETALVLELSR